jgi:hypothetical protein
VPVLTLWISIKSVAPVGNQNLVALPLDRRYTD